MSRSRRTRQKNRRKGLKSSPGSRASDRIGESLAEKTSSPVLSLLKTIFFLVLAFSPSVGWVASALVDAIPDIRLAVDETAASGTVTVRWCEYRKYSNSSDRWRYCEGTFVYDDNGEAVQVSAYGSADPGDVYPARITPEGDDAGLRDIRGVLAPLSEASFALILVGISLPLAILFVDSWILLVLPAGGVLTVVGIAGVVASLIASET